MRQRRRVVGAPAPLCAVRPHRLLRLLPEQHATKHAADTGHPVVRSFEPGENWFWNYATETAFEGPELAPPHHRPIDQTVPGPGSRVPPNWQAYIH